MHLRMAYWEYDVNYQMRCEPHKPGGVASNCNMNCIYNWTYSNSTWCEKRQLFLSFPYVCPEPVLAE